MKIIVFLWITSKVTNKKATVYAQLFYRLYSKPSEKLLELSYNLAPPNRQTDTDTFFLPGPICADGTKLYYAKQVLTRATLLHYVICNSNHNNDFTFPPLIKYIQLLWLKSLHLLRCRVNGIITNKNQINQHKTLFC